jgi:TRAP-type C4-dicarboxylate transport system permease small subunit
LLASEFWKSLKVLTVFEQWLSRVEAVAIASLLSVAAALHCSQVFSRYMFSKSFSSIDEISIYMVIAMVFLGTSRADALRQNISIDIVHNLLSEEKALTLWKISDFFLLIVSFMMGVFSTKSVLFSLSINETSVSSLGVVIWPIMAVIPMSFFLVSLRSLGRLTGIIDTKTEGSEKEVFH